MKILPVGDFFSTPKKDGHTNMTKLIVEFRNFARALKNQNFTQVI